MIISLSFVPWIYSQSDDTLINFSFDDVEIKTFVKLMGEVTGKRFVVDESVKGKITIVSPRVNVKEAYSLFVAILESAGFTVMEDAGINRIVALPEKVIFMGTVVGTNEKVPSTGFITKVIHLKYINAQQLKKSFDASKSSAEKSGKIVAIEETNHLIITDTAENIKAFEKIISEIDQPGLAKVTEIVPLKYASAGDLADIINNALRAITTPDNKSSRLPQIAGVPAITGTTPLPVVVPSAHANSLVIVGSAQEVEDIKKLIEKMDIDTPSGRGNLNAVFLKYISAEDAAKDLNSLLGKVPTAGTAEVDKRVAQTLTELSKKVAIEPNAANNALLINATPGDFEVLKRLIQQIDQPPQQVHIKVLIVEETSGDGLEFSIEGTALDLPSRTGELTTQGSLRITDKAENIMNSVQQGIFPRGLTIGIVRGTRLDTTGKLVLGYPGVLNVDALRKNSRYNILSETSLEAQNNLEATLNIVNEIPILKSTIQGGSGTSRDVIQNIDRTSVGIKLKLTPHVIPPGEQIRMVLNPIIEAVVDEGPAGSYSPTIARREVSTTVTVPDGRTIVIAGLTRSDTSKQEKRIPILGSIPVLGYLFRSRSEGQEKTNVLIFVTPTIVSDMAKAEEVKKEWEDKTGLSGSMKNDK